MGIIPAGNTASCKLNHICRSDVPEGNMQFDSHEISMASSDFTALVAQHVALSLSFIFRFSLGRLMSYANKELNVLVVL